MPDTTVTITAWSRTIDGGYRMQVAIAPCAPLQFQALSTIAASDLVYETDSHSATLTVDFGLIPFKSQWSADKATGGGSWDTELGADGEPLPAMTEQQWLDQQRRQTRINILAALASAQAVDETDNSKQLPGVGETL